MHKQTTVSATYGRQNFYAILEEVKKPGRAYTFTINGAPVAVAISIDDYESWLETMEVMRDFPNLAEDIAKSRKEYLSGDYITLDELLAKSKKNISKSTKNALRNRHTKKSTKRA